MFCRDFEYISARVVVSLLWIGQLVFGKLLGTLICYFIWEASADHCLTRPSTIYGISKAGVKEGTFFD